jgi:hypothetical protein
MSKMAKNHSQVLPGGTVPFPVPFGSPDLVLAGWDPPAGVLPLRCVNCLIQFMVTSGGAPWLVMAGKPRAMQEYVHAYHLHRIDFNISRSGQFYIFFSPKLMHERTLAPFVSLVRPPISGYPGFLFRNPLG